MEAALAMAANQWRSGKWRSQADKALILALAARVRPDRRKKILAGIEQEITAPGRRGGDIFDYVVVLIARRPQWSAVEIREELKKRFGNDPGAKACSNCIDYLVKSGRLVRVARGRYFVRGYGFGIETSDDLGV